MVKRIVSGALFLILAFSQISAKNQNIESAVYNLSMTDAMRMAMERNITIKNASLDVKKAEAQRWQAIASMLPQVNAKLDYSNMCGYEMILGMGPGMETSISMPPSGQIGVTAAIALSGAQIVSTQLTKVAMEMSDVARSKTEQEIVDQVRVLYYSALVSEETVELLAKNLESINKLHGFAQRAADVGVSEQVDADQILVQVATMETSLNSANRAKEMVYNSMRLMLDLDVNAEVSLTQNMDELLNVDSATALMLEDFDLNKNFDYQLLVKNLKLSKQQLLMKEWAYGPQLSAFYQYTGKKYFSDKSTFNMTPPNMVGLSLSIPIFSSGVKYSAVRDAKADLEKQENNLEQTEHALKIQHRQSIYNLKSAYERYQTQKQNVDVTQRVFDNMSKKYEYGATSSMDVTTSGANLITAQTSYVQSLLDFVNAQITLEQLLNK